MPDFGKMTVQRLRDIARKAFGPGHSRFKTKADLVAALEEAERSRAGGEKREGERRARVAEKAAGAVRKATRAAGETARAAARAGKEAVGAASAGARKAAKAVAGAARGSAGKKERKAPPASRPAPGGEEGREGGPDPDGFFVARVRGEDAVREAPHPMTETTKEGEQGFHAVEERARPGPWDEGLGDLPWGYGDDAFVALPRDPRSMFLYWDLAQPTVAAGFAGLDHGRAQLWLFARTGEGWDRLRTLEFAIESRGYYLHDLEPGRTYRAEIHAVDRAGRERMIGRSSNEVSLPPVGPSSIVDDRFVRIPWDMPLGRLLGPGHPGAPFPDEARALLARLSDWARFAGRATSIGAGGMGGRPSSPSSPFGGPGGKER
jgi:hypothetical protein